MKNNNATTYVDYDEIRDEVFCYDWKNKDVLCPFDEHRSPFVRVFKKYFRELGLNSLMWSSLDSPSLKVYDGGSCREVERLFSGFWSSDTRYMLGHFKNLVVVSQPPNSISAKALWTLVSSGADFLVVGQLSDIIPREGDCRLFRAVAERRLSLGYASLEDPLSSYCWWTNLRKQDSRVIAVSPSYTGRTMEQAISDSDVDINTGAGLFLTMAGASRSNLELVEIPLRQIGQVDRSSWNIIDYVETAQSKNHVGYFYVLLRKKNKC